MMQSRFQIISVFAPLKRYTAPEAYERIPMPRITPNDMDAWFTSVDYWFKACNMNSDAQRYYHVMATLDPLTLPTITQICKNAENTQRITNSGIGMYEFLKTELLKYFGESYQRKIQRLLEEMVLCDQRSSQLFNAMRRVAGNSFSEETLRAMCIQRLPELIRASVIPREGTIDVQIAVADAVMETLTQSQICSSSDHAASTTAQTQQDTIPQLSNITHELQCKFDNMRTRERSRSHTSRRFLRRHSQSSERRSSSCNTKECWYHQTFGDSANRCRSPCLRRQGTNTQHE
ncbi:PREDICTED: uncharacterized protein LOC108973082 [Bactrocera latifrons]|uniref:uncharacterized protein LOC108973082 n=1 Tax=Bactrocera latifrons TaxID=174628 RepID=UPI0008DD607C|nr:PREDICTED: uncharacterized protein LOC108973082 [Bactrocera latifrons]